jgi:hypothetical protein
MKRLLTFSRILFLMCLVCGTNMCSASIYETGAALEYVPFNNPNDAFRPCDLSQWAHTDWDGWISQANQSVYNNFGVWNGYSSYLISTDIECNGAQVEWGVGDTISQNPFALAITDNVSYSGLYYGDPPWYDQNNRPMWYMAGPVVMFDDTRQWYDGTGWIQIELRTMRTEGTGPFRLDWVTRHEAGHVWGLGGTVYHDKPDGHSLNSGDIMYGDYDTATHNGNLSQNDIDTIVWNYNTRIFH